MVFCNPLIGQEVIDGVFVTILILIDGFLQLNDIISETVKAVSHNPYFNRWFSAIKLSVSEIVDQISHNPYFNRWFSAI